jgi:hypothetical protein
MTRNYSGVIQSIAMQSQNKSSSNGQLSNTMVTFMETRFQTIILAVTNQQHAQNWLDARLLNLESQTITIGNNISTLMQHLNIPSNAKCRNDVISSETAHRKDVEITSLLHPNIMR